MLQNVQNRRENLAVWPNLSPWAQRFKVWKLAMVAFALNAIVRSSPSKRTSTWSKATRCLRGVNQVTSMGSWCYFSLLLLHFFFFFWPSLWALCLTRAMGFLISLACGFLFLMTHVLHSFEVSSTLAASLYFYFWGANYVDLRLPIHFSFSFFF